MIQFVDPTDSKRIRQWQRRNFDCEQKFRMVSSSTTDLCGLLEWRMENGRFSHRNCPFPHETITMESSSRCQKDLSLFQRPACSHTLELLYPPNFAFLLTAHLFLVCARFSLYISLSHCWSFFCNQDGGLETNCQLF